MYSVKIIIVIKIKSHKENLCIPMELHNRHKKTKLLGYILCEYIKPGMFLSIP